MSGKVVPTSGDIQFLSNANSNAVAQVFGLGTSNVSLSSLVGRAYNPSVTAAPVFVAPTVRALPLSLQRDLSGASLFLTAPTTFGISAISAGSITPTLSGGSGTYYVAIGTTPGTSNIRNWGTATSGVPIPLSLTAGTNYFLSAFLSNTTLQTKSLAVSNSSGAAPLAAPVLTNFTNLPNRASFSVTVNWGAVPGATVYDVYVGSTEVVRNHTSTSYTVNLYPYRDAVRLITVYARNAITTSPAAVGLEVFFTETPVQNQTVTFSRSTTHTVVGVGAGGAAGYDHGRSRGLGGAGGITSVQTYHARTSFTYWVGATGSHGDSDYAYHGRGGQATTVVVGSETLMIVGGGGGGATNYPWSGTGSTDTDQLTDYRMFSGGAGGVNAGFGSPGGGGWIYTQVIDHIQDGMRVGNMINYVGFGGGGDHTSGGAAGGVAATTYNGDWVGGWFGHLNNNTGDQRIPPSRVPTAGVNSDGGRSGIISWFFYTYAGAGGQGFKGGGGGGCVQMVSQGDHGNWYAWWTTDPFFGYKFAIGAGGGGGGSSWVQGAYANPDGTTYSGSGSDVNGMLFIAARA
jgi:hypothetical protein